MRWIDEHPTRYAPIEDGDMACMAIDGHVHFIRLTVRPGVVFPADDAAACGHPMPSDWPRHNTDFPIAGVVDCDGCLAAYRHAITPGT